MNEFIKKKKKMQSALWFCNSNCKLLSFNIEIIINYRNYCNSFFFKRFICIYLTDYINLCKIAILYIYKNIKENTIMRTIILITMGIITMKMQYVEKTEPVQFQTFLDNVFISNVTFTSNKTWISHLDASPSHRILLKILHVTSNAQPHLFTLYLLHRDATH